MSTASQRWVKVEKGIRYREHPTRKHGIQRDKYYVLRFAVDGKTCQEALGWSSEGITLDKARVELAKLREAKRTGIGPRSLSEKRSLQEIERQRQESESKSSQIDLLTVSCFWNNTYWPAQAHKAPGSRVAEDAVWRKWILPEIGHIALTVLAPTHLETIKARMLSAEKAPSTHCCPAKG